jgi:ABC-type multidrug transport system ATPase subunit
MAMLLEINRNGGTTVIICTHDSAMVDRMKQRVIEIEDGLISRDEKKSGYRGDQAADHEAYMPPVSRTSYYAGKEEVSGIAFGDDEAYSDNYDDAEYQPAETVSPAPGFVFGDDANGAAAVSAPVEEPFKMDEEEITPQDKAPESVPETKIEDIPSEEIPVEDVKTEEAPAAAEEETEVPLEEPFIAFGDEVKSEPAAAEVNAPAEKEADPDITADDALTCPSEETYTASKDNKREEKKKSREDRLAQKEARRKEKLDKKKKVRRTDFMPGSDIDIFPEDEE